MTKLTIELRMSRLGIRLRCAWYRFRYDAKSEERWWGCVMIGALLVGMVVAAMVEGSVR